MNISKFFFHNFFLNIFVCFSLIFGFFFSFLGLLSLHIYIFDFYLIAGLMLFILFVSFFKVSSLTKKNTYFFFILYLVFGIFILLVDLFTYQNNFVMNNILMLIQVKLCLLFFTLFYTISIKDYYLYTNNIRSTDFFIFIGFILIGSCLLISAEHLLLVFIALELISFSSYVLVGYDRKSLLSNEASVKYLILGGLSTVSFLIGMAFAYFYLGTLELDVFKKYLYVLINNEMGVPLFYPKILILATIFLMTSFFFKMGAAPFHFWLADIFEGALTGVSFFLAIVPKISMFFTLLKFIDIFTIYSNYLLMIIYLSLIFGSFLAYSQTRTKRFLAYSSITHLGFACLPIITGIDNFIYYVLFYFMHYIIISFVLWLCILIMFNIQEKKIRNLIEFSSAFLLRPLLSFSLSIIILSLAGIPPFIGFWSKFFLFVPLIATKFYFLTFFALMISFLAIQYYIKVLKLIFYEEFVFSFYTSLSINACIIFSFFVCFILLASLFPSIFGDFIGFINFMDHLPNFLMKDLLNYTNDI